MTDLSHPSDRPRRHPDSAFRAIDEEGGLVVLPGHAEVKVLNPVGIRIYALLDGTRSLADIATTIAEEFEVTQEDAHRDVRAFVDELEANRMLAGQGAAR